MATERYHTRVIVRVASHHGGPDHPGGQVIDLSKDCIAFQTSKNTKARGRFQLQLVPRRNYLNLVFPNDVVNIYVDPGDGKTGFTRLMFGYVDRVERQESVDDNGAVQTRYTIIGSDFQKAVDQTLLYFNGYLKQKLDERFVRTLTGAGRPAFSNTSGIALRNQGLTAVGTPADFVENMLRVLLGFAQQWQLPDTYARTQQNLQNARSRRVQKAKDRLPTAVTKLIAKFGHDPEQIDKDIEAIITKAEQLLRQEDDLQKLKSVSKFAGFAQIAAQTAESISQNAALLAFRAAVQAEQDPSLPTGIFDLLNLDFIESLCIDGFNQSAGIWTTGSGTSLGQFVYGHSNEIVNELIFDLRPISDGADGLVAGLYARNEDELGINVNGTEDMPATVPGVRYEPAVIFREYPYSTIDKYDLSNIAVVSPGPGENPGSGINAGLIRFGPVFSLGVNVEGRKTYTYPKAIHPEEENFPKGAIPIKHIDVVVIKNTDVTQSALGRSDEDVVNVLQLYANSPTPTVQYRDQIGNFCPILNHISIARHGFRVREVNTSFANLVKNDGTAFRRKNLVRWQMLMDHWYQHNIEYLTGTISLRGRPDIRCGYRIDWEDRNESYYIEGVSHSWQYPGPLETTVEVSRGQRNDPFPVYIPPVFTNDKGDTMQSTSGDRSRDGRLALFFPVRDTKATLGATNRDEQWLSEGPNHVDDPERLGDKTKHVPHFVAPGGEEAVRQLLGPQDPRTGPDIGPGEVEGERTE